ncbi:MAG: PAS domain S-box protein, partial [Desulfobacteraceae bacterium]|nr:PAS domain S-box protein [Desulfobacteraceae bacterium]
GWEFNIDTLEQNWTEETFRIHEVDLNYDHTIENGINFYTPDSKPIIENAVQRAIEFKEPFDLELQIITAKDNLRHVHTIGRIDLANRRIFGFFQDITERKQAEEALRENEEKFRTLVDQAADMLIVHDMDGRIIDVNKASVKGYGYSREELLSMKVSDLDQNYVERENSGRFWDRFGMNEPYRFEVRQRRKDGTIFPVEVTITKLMINKQLVIMALCRDISGIKETEAEKEKLQAQLTQAQKMESVGRLAGGVAHDFNNMLGVILGHLEFALEKVEQDHDLYDDLNEIKNAANRSVKLTKQLLTFARKDIISPKQIDLNDTVESMLNMLRRLIGEDIDLVWQPSAHLWPVKMDPTQIDQILANLGVNARDAIAGVGKLTIETGKETFDQEYCNDHPGFIPGDFVLLAVSDNGSGMDKDTLDNLFEPFFTTKEVGKGTGLGLATIYGIVKQNNGFINVYSESGQGSTFKIYLPRLVADEETDKAVTEKKAAAGGTETILLVEDEPIMSGYTANVIAHQGVLDDGVAFIQKPFSMADMTEKVRNVLDTAPDQGQQ